MRMKLAKATKRIKTRIQSYEKTMFSLKGRKCSAGYHKPGSAKHW